MGGQHERSRISWDRGKMGATYTQCLFLALYHIYKPHRISVHAPTTPPPSEGTHINAKPAVNTTDELIPSKSLPTHITANEGASIRTSCERRREKSPPSIMERRERRYSERVAIGGVAEAKTEVR